METPAPTVKNRYFIKELVNNKLWSTKGYAIPFEDIGDDLGVLVTTHQGLIEELEIAIHHRRGGVREATEEEIEEVKKKALEQEMRRSSLSTNRIDKSRVASTRPFNQNPSPQSEAAVDGEVNKPKAPVPSQPLDPVPVIDAALLRPKPAKRKLRDVEVSPNATPMLVPVPEPVQPTSHSSGG